jgi:PIF1-like helicase
MTENDLEIYEKSRTSWREEQYGNDAMEIACSQGIFAGENSVWQFEDGGVNVALGGDLAKLERWQSQMLQDAAKQDALRNVEKEVNNRADDVEIFNDIQYQNDTAADVEMIGNPETHVHETLPPVDASHLLPSQRRAYDILDWHLQENLAGHYPPQLLMTMVGEGGTGKSQTIQSISENFRSKTIPLVKAAYTEIAASIIGGKTLHRIGMIPLNGQRQSAQTLKKLELLWKDKQYLIIDEISMVSRQFFA